MYSFQKITETRLAVDKAALVRAKVVTHKARVQGCLKYFTQNVSKRNRSIIACIIGLTFLCKAVTIACFHGLGMQHVLAAA